MILEIRAARGDETALAARISHDVWHETQAQLQDPAVGALRTPLFFADRLDDQDAKPLLAFVDDHPAGTAAWDSMEVRQLFVLPHWRGMGVGRALLRACEELMTEAGVACASVSCVCGNAWGRQFYERCNWSLVGLNSRSVESARGPVNVLHWEFHKQMIQNGETEQAARGNGLPG